MSVVRSLRRTVKTTRWNAVRVALKRGADERDLISVSTDHTAYLTPAKARELASVLIELADRAGNEVP